MKSKGLGSTHIMAAPPVFAPTAVPEGTLTVLSGPRSGELLDVSAASMQLGRDPTCELPFEDTGVSRTHARIDREGDAYFLSDLGSTNGTYVDGRPVSVRHPLRDGARVHLGQQLVLRFSLLDAVEREAARRLYELSVRDALTGLLNRGQFDERLAAEFSYARRHGSPLCVLVLDVDHFKRINDTHGHPAGDAVLRTLGRVLASHTREEDVVARYGGEEFVVIARGIDPRQAALFAERLRSVIASTDIATDGPPLRVTVSIGVAHTDHAVTFESPSALVAVADRALYAAKSAGRNRVVQSGSIAPGGGQPSTPARRDVRETHDLAWARALQSHEREAWRTP